MTIELLEDRKTCGPRLCLCATTCDGRTVVRVEGEVEVNSAGELRDYFLSLTRAGHRDLLVDLEAVEFIDAIGVNVLRSVGKRARACGGSLNLVCRRDRADWLFAFVARPADVSIFDTLPTATATAG